MMLLRGRRASSCVWETKAGVQAIGGWVVWCGLCARTPLDQWIWWDRTLALHNDLGPLGQSATPFAAMSRSGW